MGYADDVQKEKAVNARNDLVNVNDTDAHRKCRLLLLYALRFLLLFHTGNNTYKVHAVCDTFFCCSLAEIERLSFGCDASGCMRHKV